jgi:hypothetical protein
MIKLKMVVATVQVQAGCISKSLNFPKDIINQRKMHWFPDHVLVYLTKVS